jgi:hypothetical protein
VLSRPALSPIYPALLLLIYSCATFLLMERERKDLPESATPEPSVTVQLDKIIELLGVIARRLGARFLNG